MISPAVHAAAAYVAVVNAWRESRARTDRAREAVQGTIDYPWSEPSDVNAVLAESAAALDSEARTVEALLRARGAR